MPTPMQVSIPLFRPNLRMSWVTGTTLMAVPVIIKAMGAVAHAAEGANCAPIRVPAKTISGMVDPANAQLMLSIQTFLKSLCEIMLIGLSLFYFLSRYWLQRRSIN